MWPGVNWAFNFNYISRINTSDSCWGTGQRTSQTEEQGRKRRKKDVKFLPSLCFCCFFMRETNWKDYSFHFHRAATQQRIVSLNQGSLQCNESNLHYYFTNNLSDKDYSPFNHVEENRTSCQNPRFQTYSKVQSLSLLLKTLLLSWNLETLFKQINRFMIELWTKVL